MVDRRSFFWSAIAVAAMVLCLAALSHADTLHFSCTGDQAATGYLLQNTDSLSTPAWVTVLNTGVCDFTTERPTAKKFWRICAYNTSVTVCREDVGYYNMPTPATLTVGTTTLQ